MKAIAIEQIILIVLGVIVLGVVGYLLYINFLAGGGQMTYEKCRSMALSYCGGCRLKDYDTYTSCIIKFASTKDRDTCKTHLSEGFKGDEGTDGFKFDCTKLIPW
jgi:hypothetical protein